MMPNIWSGWSQAGRGEDEVDRESEPRFNALAGCDSTALFCGVWGALPNILLVMAAAAELTGKIPEDTGLGLASSGIA